MIKVCHVGIFTMKCLIICKNRFLKRKLFFKQFKNVMNNFLLHNLGFRVWRNWNSNGVHKEEPWFSSNTHQWRHTKFFLYFYILFGGCHPLGKVHLLEKCLPDIGVHPRAYSFYGRFMMHFTRQTVINLLPYDNWKMISIK